MSELFSIQLQNRQQQGRDGVWLDLPTTTEQVQAALRQIGISSDNPQGLFISGYFAEEEKRFAIPYNMVLASNVDELNFLASRLETLSAGERAELNAALQAPQSELFSIGRITDFPENVDYYVHLPDVHGPAQLGDYYLNRSGMVNMPEEWKGGIDTAQFGRYVAQQEQGAFTQYGYLVKSGDEWQKVHEGQPVPEEYRVLSFPAPEVLRDSANIPPPVQPETEPQKVIPIILNGKDSAERMKEITDRLETGIQELFDSDRYKAYLTTMAKFHNYSFNNTLLIAMQGGQLVAGFNKWKDTFHRTVKKGEKGIKILAPAPYKVKQKTEKRDEQGKPILDKDGKPLTEEKTVQIPAFKVVSVFDVSQTEGEPLPSIAVNELSGSVQDYQDFFKALEQASPVPIGFEDIEGGAHGYFHLLDNRIAIQEGMSQLQTIKTAIHEIAHAKLHAIDPLLDVHGLVVGQRIEHRLAQLLLAFHLVHAQGAAAVGRLHANWIPADDAVGHHIERRGRTHALESIARQVDTLGPGRAALLASPVAVLRQRRVQGVLVPSAMADARRRAHERDAEELQQALDGAVLAVLAVQGVVHHIGPLAAQRGNQIGVGVQGHHLVAGLFQRLAHHLAGGQRHLALEGLASHEHCNFHTRLLCC